MKKLVSVLLALALALGVCGAFAESASLPAYTYHGEDPVWAAKYMHMHRPGREDYETFLKSVFAAVRAAVPDDLDFFARMIEPTVPEVFATVAFRTQQRRMTGEFAVIPTKPPRL